MTHPSSSLNILRKKEKKIALGIPSIAVKKKIAIRVKCIGLRSGKIFNNKQTLETINDYKPS